jgi:hypothetical protein
LKSLGTRNKIYQKRGRKKYARCFSAYRKNQKYPLHYPLAICVDVFWEWEYMKGKEKEELKNKRDGKGWK